MKQEQLENMIKQGKELLQTNGNYEMQMSDLMNLVSPIFGGGLTTTNCIKLLSTLINSVLLEEETIIETSQKESDFYISLFNEIIDKNTLKQADLYSLDFCKFYGCENKSPLNMMFIGFMLALNIKL